MIQIFLDIDGCLVNTDGEESPSSLYYLGLSQVAGYVKGGNCGQNPPIGFCTGRDRNYVEAVAYVLGLPNAWSVIESGIAIFNPTTKDLVFNPVLTNQTKEAFREISEGKIPQILGKYPFLFLYPGNLLNIALERKYGIASPIEDCFKAVREELKDFEELIHITHSNIAIDISPAGVDKGSGVKFLAEYADIDLSKSLGVGDSRGDFLMLELVGYVGCPANAKKECKELINKKGGYIAKDDYAQGVAEVIGHFQKTLLKGTE